MKSSKFNIFFKYQNVDVGFNSLTHEYIMLDPVNMELFTAGLRKNNFDELKEVHSDFYNFLIQQGFLVDNSIDEFQVVKEMARKIDDNDSQFDLIINPTMNCNFKCWYCYETHIKDSKMDESTIQATIKFIENVLENQKGIKRFNLSFFGGEPLLYFEKVVKPILAPPGKHATKEVFPLKLG